LIKEILGPGIVIYKNVFSDTNNLIKRYEDVIKKTETLSWSDAEIYKDGAITRYSTRICQDFIYDRPSENKNDEATTELRLLYDNIVGVIKNCLNDYQKDYPVSLEYFEALNIVKYSPNNFFNYHTDDGKNNRYTVSTVGYLNDNFEGGELHFKFFNVSYKPESGDLAIFPSSYIYAHAAYPIKSGTKYIVALMTDISKRGQKIDLISQ